MKRYPIFRVYKPSKEEQALTEIQKPVLEKLSASGFGVKISDDIFMDIPCRIDENNYPFELYSCINNIPTLTKTFQSWEEIEKFANSIN